MPSLTRIEAAERAALLIVDSYHLTLTLGADLRTFRSRSEIHFRSRTPGAATFVDVKAAEIKHAELNAQPIDPALLVDGRLPIADLAEHNVLVVDAEMAYSSDGEGLHRHVDPADGRSYLYAMSFLDAAPRWFACFDQPDLKAGYRIDVDCPPEWTVLGNGTATSSPDGTWTLTSPAPLSTYFVTLVAGPYHSVVSEHDGIRLGLHARASLAAHLDREAPEILRVTRQAFGRYHELFGVRYPFGDDYHQAFVPDFNAGAMENPGCVTLRDQYVFRAASTAGERANRANTIAHELAHMWFGNLVTMRWWDDLWLNESFAEYLATRACAEVTDYPAWADFGIKRKDWGYIADQAPSTHAVAGNGSADAAAALDAFDGISYAKGAAVLKQLAGYLGDTVFFDGLRQHFAAHRFGNAEFGDLVAAWKQAGAVDLDDWMHAWLRTTGLDTITGSVTDDRAVISRTGGNRPHAITVAGLSDSGERLWGKAVLLNRDQHALDVGPVEGAAFVLPDCDDETWAKIRVTVPGSAGSADAARQPGASGDGGLSAGFAVLGGALPGISEPGSRVVAYNAIRDAVRDGELDAAGALDVVLAAIAGEPNDAIVASMFGFATATLAGPFCPIDERRNRAAQIATAAAAMCGRAAAGSALQLTAARAFVAATGDTDRLQSWLAGAGVPDRLVIDDELRWAITERLAALGSIDDDGIDTALTADRSAAGAVHAARARARRADPSAKARAWSLLTEPSELSAYELYATAEGFFDPLHTDLTATYAERYFNELPATARFRRGWSLGQITLLSYPLSHADASLIRRADETLAADLDPTVRRSLVDATDVARRAHVARERSEPAQPRRGDVTDMQ